MNGLYLCFKWVTFVLGVNLGTASFCSIDTRAMVAAQNSVSLYHCAAVYLADRISHIIETNEARSSSTFLERRISHVRCHRLVK